MVHSTTTQIYFHVIISASTDVYLNNKQPQKLLPPTPALICGQLSGCNHSLSKSTLFQDLLFIICTKKNNNGKIIVTSQYSKIPIFWGGLVTRQLSGSTAGIRGKTNLEYKAKAWFMLLHNTYEQRLWTHSTPSLAYIIMCCLPHSVTEATRVLQKWRYFYALGGTTGFNPLHLGLLVDIITSGKEHNKQIIHSPSLSAFKRPWCTTEHYCDACNVNHTDPKQRSYTPLPSWLTWYG